MRPALALAGVLIAGACAAQPSSGELTGLITRVTKDSVSVRSDGRTETFVNGASDVPVDHLREHQTGRLPVKIGWQLRDGKRVATRIDDA